jgi:long-chain acyl-CoA synthetase
MHMIANSPYNLANLIFAVAEKNLDRTAITTMDASVSFGQLQTLVTNFAARMQHHGITRSCCVALNIEHPVIAIALTIACSLVGSSWAPATSSVGASKDLLVTHVLHDGARRLEARDNFLLVDPSWSQPMQGNDDTQAVCFEGYRSPTDAWMITQSSGTTGTPKLMALDEVMTWRRTTETIAAKFPANPVLVCLFHPLSKPGILHALRILAIGGTAVFADILDIFGRARVDCVLGAPNHFTKFLDAAPPVRARIPLAIVGGASARKPFFSRMLRYFDAISYIYASTEASIVSTNLITEVESIQGAVSVGRPAPGTMVRIVGEDGTELPPLREGIVTLRTPWQVTGYIGNSELTANIFQDGWFYPGDLGYLAETGELYITGRVNDQLNVGGVKLNPDHIDELIQSTPGIKDGICFAQPTTNGIDQLVAAISIAGPVDLGRVIESLHKRLRDKFEPSQTPNNIYIVNEIPRNPNGKIMRSQLVEAVRGLTPIDVALLP